MGSKRSGVNIFRFSFTEIHTARKLGVPIYQLLGGKVRDKIKVYAWIGGDRPSDIAAQAFVPYHSV